MTPLDATPRPVPESGIGEAGALDHLVEHQRKVRRRKVTLLGAILSVLAIIIAILIYRAITGHPPQGIGGIGGSKVPHYAFSIYGTSRPMGVAVNGSGDRIYVTESDGRRLVRVYDRSGHQVGTLKPPGAAGAAHVPVYVAVDPATDDVYVSDRLRAAVYVYDARGGYRRTFRPRANLGGGAKPLGLAFGPQGGLHVTDVSGPFHRILVFRRDGRLLRRLGSPGQLAFPNGIAVDASGNVYASDSNHGRLVIFDPAGRPVASISRGVGQGDLGLPRGAAIDAGGRLYVVDTTAHAVKLYRIADKGVKPPTYIGSFGEEGMLDGMFEYPNGVAADGDGRVYVTDRENNRVQVWRY